MVSEAVRVPARIEIVGTRAGRRASSATDGRNIVAPCAFVVWFHPSHRRALQRRVIGRVVWSLEPPR